MNIQEEFCKKEKLNSIYLCDQPNSNIVSWKYVNFLEKELTASRDSRLLSAVPSEECVFTHQYGRWHENTKTSCGDDIYNPSARFKFCPYCGKPIKHDIERGIAR